MNQVLAVFVAGTLLACREGNSNRSEPESGKELYKTYCAACHGANGKLNLNGAPDLTVSKMTMEERIKNITEGGSMMPAFAEVISAEQIKAVAAYLDQLK